MITSDTQRAIIQRQIDEWEQARYHAEVAHRVHTKLKSGDAALKDFTDRMIKAEMALDELQAMLKELDDA